MRQESTCPQQEATEARPAKHRWASESTAERGAVCACCKTLMELHEQRNVLLQAQVWNYGSLLRH